MTKEKMVDLVQVIGIGIVIITILISLGRFAQIVANDSMRIEQTESRLNNISPRITTLEANYVNIEKALIRIETKIETKLDKKQ